MLQLLMAAAFSAAPLTLYVPPVRSLSLFVEAMEVVCRDCSPYSHDVVAHFRVGFSRVLAGLAQPISGRSQKTTADDWCRDLCLQATVDRSKGNKTEISKSELIQKSAYCRVS
ncbi:hypothetical protein ACJX0J_026680, partial [Zea mays]